MAAENKEPATLNVYGLVARDGKLFFQCADASMKPCFERETTAEQLKQLAPCMCLDKQGRPHLADANGRPFLRVDDDVGKLVWNDTELKQIRSAQALSAGLEKAVPKNKRHLFHAIFSGQIYHSAATWAELELLIKDTHLAFKIYKPHFDE